MALDPALAEAHAAACMLFFIQANWEEALAHYEKAIQINPNYAIVYNWMAILLFTELGRYAESFAALENAAHLDPLSISTRYNYVAHLINRNRFAEADLEQKKLATLAPYWFGRLQTARMFFGGEWAKAVLGSLDSLRIGDDSERSRTILASRFAVIGLEKEAFALTGTPRFGVMRIPGRPEDAVTVVEARLVDYLSGEHEEGGWR